MAKRNGALGGAFGSGSGGGGSPTLPSGATPAPNLSRKQQKRITHGMHGDPTNPYDTGIPGNITSGAGSFVANENPDDYWTWLNAKAGLNVNPQTAFGKWDANQNDYYQQLFGAYKLDNPNAYFSNFLGGYGWGSPTVDDPKAKGNPLGGDGGGGNHRAKQSNDNGNDGGRDHKRNDGGRDHKRKGGRRGGRPNPPPSSGSSTPRGSQ